MLPTCQIKEKIFKGTILLIIKPLYDLVKAGNHCFLTYLDHHKEKLGMEMLFDNICLVIIRDRGENLGIIGFQTNNILNIGTKVFMKKDKKEIIKAKFKAKNQTMLETSVSGDFNSGMTIGAKFIMVVQKNQVEKLVLVDVTDNAKK